MLLLKISDNRFLQALSSISTLPIMLVSILVLCLFVVMAWSQAMAGDEATVPFYKEGPPPPPIPVPLPGSPAVTNLCALNGLPDDCMAPPPPKPTGEALKNYRPSPIRTPLGVPVVKSPAHIAIIKNDEAALRKLLEEGLDPDSSLELPPAEHRSLLWGAQYCRANIVKILLEYGANPNVKSRTLYGWLTFNDKIKLALERLERNKRSASGTRTYEQDKMCYIETQKILAEFAERNKEIKD